MASNTNLVVSLSSAVRTVSLFLTFASFLLNHLLIHRRTRFYPIPSWLGAFRGELLSKVFWEIQIYYIYQINLIHVVVGPLRAVQQVGKSTIFPFKNYVGSSSLARLSFQCVVIPVLIILSIDFPGTDIRLIGLQFLSNSLILI